MEEMQKKACEVQKNMHAFTVQFTSYSLPHKTITNSRRLQLLFYILNCFGYYRGSKMLTQELERWRWQLSQRN